MLPGRAQSDQPGGNHQNGLCGFNSSGERFALSTGGGVFKVFNTVTGELEQQVGLGGEEEHLVADYGSMVWASSPGKTPGKSKKKSKAVSMAGGALLVLGNRKGDVVAFNAALGDIAWRAQRCHTGEVAALAYSATTGTVYTAGADGHVCELDADSGAVQANWKAGKTPLTALAASADGDRLLVAGASLSLWDLASHERMGKLSGHAIPAHLVAFSPDASRAVSAAPGEPAVVLWNGTGGGGTPGKGARAGALATLSMDHPPAQLTTHATGGKKHFGVLAVCEVGEAYLWRCGDKGAAAAAWRVRVTVPRGVSVNTGGECVLAARCGAMEGGMMVVRGALARPSFQELPAPPTTTTTGTDGGGGALTELEATAEAASSTGGGHKGSAAANASAANAAVLGPDAAAASLRPSVSGRKRTAVDDDADGTPEAMEVGAASSGGEVVGMVVEDALDVSSGEGTDGDLTIGERLAALGLEGSVAADKELSHNKRFDGLGEAPKADSLGVLLAQAVRAADRALLERCLSVGDEAVVHNTVSHLAPADAVALLEQLLARPGRGVQLSRWLKAVLMCHPAYLMAAPAARPHMTALYQVLEARLAMMRPLLSLTGRLELLLAQQASHAARSAGEESGKGDGPLVDYTEPEAEEQLEIEDPFALGAAEGDSEDGWETDDGNDLDSDVESAEEDDE